jgi:thiol-disulfide isomerase/thioredoxin
VRTLVTVATVLVVTVIGGCGPATPAGPTLVPQERAAPLAPIDLALIDGGRWSSKDALGQVLVIDVWATYCKPCRASFPKLNRLATDHGGEVRVVGISVDEQDDVVRAFLAEVPATFAIARDPTLTVQAAPLAIAHLPTVLVVDRRGRVRFRGDELPESGYDALPAMVDALIADDGGDTAAAR